eukprot:TRINITY_DN3013_c0_g1_i2.p1 TRINITY_DN3013_c0_g1~~TRINITY_DN3013_c0_g1_i2.p1  ORF type:complete len:102 (-),score=16.55 TRINITY_DN3013_c0_g1_i2:61-366(-)
MVFNEVTTTQRTTSNKRCKKRIQRTSSFRGGGICDDAQLDMETSMRELMEISWKFYERIYKDSNSNSQFGFLLNKHMPPSRPSKTLFFSQQNEEDSTGDQD